MQIHYRQASLRDLKKLKTYPIYNEVFDFVFTFLPKVKSLQKVNNVKAMRGYPHRYRIRISDYRIGIEVHGNTIEIARILHRREFYRYFP